MIRHSPLRVGLTGGIGSGKSLICRMFGMLGVPVYDSDSRARRLMETDSALTGSLKEAFGTELYREGRLDRAALAGRVFGDSDALALLNALVHPAVLRDFAAWADSQQAAYVIAESAILFESGMDRETDFDITVSAPDRIRLQRAMARDGADEKSVAARMAAQAGDAKREQMADRIIVNDGRRLVWEQVAALDTEIRRMAGANGTYPGSSWTRK